MRGWIGLSDGIPRTRISKKVLCVRLWKGTCFCRRIILSFFFFLLSSSVTQKRALKLRFSQEKRCFREGGRREPGGEREK